MKTVTLNGAAFTDLRGFYREMAQLLAPGREDEIGRNLDALCDLLRGGFGFHDYGEELTIVWENYAASRANLGERETLRLMEVMLDSDMGHKCHVELKE